MLTTETITKDIDEEKKQVINGLEGKYLVLAGPGTGKTTALIERIKNIIKLGQEGKELGTAPERILCLTYTDAAATEMKDRIQDEMGDDIDVKIFTFHSFCMDIIKNYSSEFENIGENSKIITDAISRYFIKDIIDNSELEYYVTSTGDSYYYIDEIKKGIEEIKKFGLSDDDFLKNLKIWEDELAELKRASNDSESEINRIKPIYDEKNRLSEAAKNKHNDLITKHKNETDKAKKKALYEQKKLAKNEAEEAERIFKDIKSEYELYITSNKKYSSNIETLDTKIGKMKELFMFHQKYRDEKMIPKNYIDFSDMIIKVLEKFKSDPLFTDKIAMDYDYIMVDEYQDTNPIQNQIIYQLGETGRCKNILAVGDDDQTIYSFQGARIDTMDDYIKTLDVPQSNFLTLNTNWRFTKNINNVSYQIAQCQTRYSDFLYEKRATKKQKEFLEDNQYEQSYIPLEKQYKNINKRLKNDKDGSLVLCREYKTPEQEKIDILTQIKELASGAMKDNLREIAVLTRTNKELRTYAQLLEHSGIPYELKDGKDIFEIKASAILFNYLELLVDPDLYSDKFLSYLLSEPFKISAQDYTNIYNKRAHYKNFIAIMNSILYFEEESEETDTEKTKEEIEKEKETKKSKQEEIKNNLEKFIEEDKDGEPLYHSFMEILEKEYPKHTRMKKFRDDYNLLKKFNDSQFIKNTILRVADVTGILQEFCNPDNNECSNYAENLLGIKKLADEAEGFEAIYRDLDKTPTLIDFVNYLRDISEKGGTINTDKPSYKLNAVQLSSVHSSKGKQYEYVFMPNLCSGNWEGNTKSSKDIIPLGKTYYVQPQDDEQPDYTLGWIEKELKFIENAKLMFVGMTRAKKELHISYNGTSPSWFIKEITQNASELGIAENIDFKQLQSDDKDDEKIQYELLSSFNFVHTEEFEELINRKISNIKHFSPSSLNSYIKCPRKYFYENILGLKPEMQDSDITQYGKAVHFACQKAVEHITKNKKTSPVTREEFFEFFTDFLNKAPLSKDGKESLIKKGKTYLIEGIKDKDKKPFYDEFIANGSITNYQKAEYTINFKVDNIPFEGIIDRLDTDVDNPEYVVIYDYKTGNPKNSDITIDGKKKDYYRQIAFYKYALNKGGATIDGERVSVSKTVFIYPDQCNKFPLTLTKDDVIKVKDIYVQAAKDIIEQKFDILCKDEDTCKYCKNKVFCGLDTTTYLKEIEEPKSAKETDK